MIPVIFINCKEYPFVDWILSGKKKCETRNKNTLGRFIGERIMIAETGNGRPLVRCTAVISRCIGVYSKQSWREHVSEDDVPLGSSYDWKDDTKKKVVYTLKDIRPVKPYHPDGLRHGRVWMECNDHHPETEDNYALTTVNSFIEAFEDFLEERGIDIPNEEKEQSEGPCIIYGTDYGDLYERIEHLLINLGAL